MGYCVIIFEFCNVCCLITPTSLQFVVVLCLTLSVLRPENRWRSEEKFRSNHMWRFFLYKTAFILNKWSWNAEMLHAFVVCYSNIAFKISMKGRHHMLDLSVLPDRELVFCASWMITLFFQFVPWYQVSLSELKFYYY